MGENLHFWADQNFEEIRANCIEAGTLFEDPEFPADESSLNLDTNDEIVWMRATEINPGAQFMVDGASRFDINQGELGDCWFLAATANLTEHTGLFEKVIPPDQTFNPDEYAGIFHFRFWQFGHWVDVVVDDYLPTKYGGQLFLMRSNVENEFWSALFEKAYAKIHGSYKALSGGNGNEALEDFSGGCGETFMLAEQDPDSIFKIILQASNRGSMMVCSTFSDAEVVEKKLESGLVSGHAYSLTKVIQVGSNNLLRIRNPWGNEAEWKLNWSDNSAEWDSLSDEEKAALEFDAKDDGEFFMDVNDFIVHFESLEICNLTPDALNEGQIGWHEDQFRGSWVAGSSAGGCINYRETTFPMNPQFLITLTDSDEDEDDLCTCLVALMQIGGRQRKACGEGGCLSIGFIIYYIENPDEVPTPLDTNFFLYNASKGSCTFCNSREVVKRFKLPPGTYAIIPSTFDPDQEGEFILRIFSEKGTSTN